MAYIERAYLTEQFESRLHDDNVMCPVIKVLDALEIIDTAPSADVEEVKHGKWIDDIQEFTSPAGVTQKYLCGYKCSLCGRSERTKEPYCNCGAKMDGGKAE